MTLHVLSVDDFSEQQLLTLSDPNPSSGASQNKTASGLLTCFFQQPSLRTMSSFLGAAVAVGYTPVQVFSGGDELREQCDVEDELVQLSRLCQVAVVRTKASLNAPLLRTMDIPFINAGDGSNEHPTQALVDLMALRQAGLHEGKRVLMMGNMRDHRTQHSLVKALLRVGADVELLSPPDMAMPVRFTQGRLSTKETTCTHEVDDALSRADLVYITPAQFWGSEKERMGTAFLLNRERALRVFKPTAKVFHPFPRLGELSRDLDGTSFDGYTQQAQQGPLVRKRLLSAVAARAAD